MSQSVIGALRVNLGLDSAQFEKGLGSARKRLGDMRKQFAAFSALAAAAATGLSALTVATARSANEITRFSQVAGAAPEDLQRWAAGAKTVGVEQDKLADILKDVNDRIGDYAATGAGPMADFFENIAPKVGVTADQFRKLSGPDALQLYVSSLEKAGASQQDMTFYLEAMASDATALLPLLRNGGAEMQRLGDRADSLGAVMDASTLAVLGRTHLALMDVGQALQGVGNRIASSLAPTLTTLATGFTNAMLEGGWLRQVTDALIDNIGRLAAYVATAAGMLGVRYVSALVAARAMLVAVNLQTLGLVGSLKLLRGAIARTGFGLLVIGAAELGMWFGRLVKAAGGFGDAMILLGDLAAVVWDGIATSARSLVPGLGYIWKTIQAGFLTMLANLSKKWSDFLHKVSDGLQNVPGFDAASLAIDGAAIKAGSSFYEMEHAAEEAAGAARGLRTEAEGLASAGWDKAKDAAAKLAAAVADAGEETLGGAAAADELARALENAPDLSGGGLPINTGGGAGGGGGKSAAESKAAAEAEKRLQVLKDLRAEHEKLTATLNMTDLQAKIWTDTQAAGTTATSAQGREIARLNTEIDEMTQAKDRASQMADTLKQSAGSAFSSIVTGAASAKDAIASLAQNLASMFADQAFNSIWGAIAPSIPGAIPSVAIGANARGTANWRGGLTRINELGGEIMNLPRGTQIIPHDISKRMADGAAGMVDVRVSLDGHLLQAEIAGTAGPVAAQLIQANNEQLAQSQRRS